jgi:putative phage-type endonuclease
MVDKSVKDRMDYIGGSDAPILMGLSPYENSIDLWRLKTGQIQPKDLSDNKYVKAGIMLEPAIIKWFEDETGLNVVNNNVFYFHKEHEFIAGHLDGWIESENAVFEAKTSSSDKGWGPKGSNQIPDHYLIQISHYMLVTGADKAYIAVLIRGIDFRYYVINKNERLQEIILQKEIAFWQKVQSNIIPDPLNNREIISLNEYKSTDGSVCADTDIQSCIERLEQVNFQMSVLSDEKDKLSDRIKVFMGEKDTLLDINGKIAATWKGAKQSRRFDLEAFKKDKPDEFMNYNKSFNSSRRFLIKINERRNEEQQNEQI